MRQDERKRAVGRRFIVGFPGPEVDDTLRRLIAEYGLGGVILFPRNFRSRDQIRALTAELQQRAEGRLIVSVDQEGGRVQRLGPALGYRPYPSGEALGRQCREAGSSQPAREVGRALGEDLVQLGINVVWAPVVDLRTNPANRVIGDRAFGTTPEEVIPVARAFLQGLGEAGVRGCLKHFPGHGDTAADSHEELPLFDRTIESMERREWVPFRQLAGSAPFVMTAHLKVPAVDPLWPVTLSPVWMRILRERIGFRGSVVSDALEMKAIRRQWGLEEAARRAMEAGCDFVMQADGWEGVEEAIRALADRRDSAQGIPEAPPTRIRRRRRHSP